MRKRRKSATRDRILEKSIELFNARGVSEVTTNHLAQGLGMSPGNLYFHYPNKEAIIRELFDHMCLQNYEIWKVRHPVQGPIEIIDRTFELFWTYRFFHREMYHLRHRDVVLSRLWKKHLRKVTLLLSALYRRWERQGIMRNLRRQQEMHFLFEVLLATASSYFLFYEGLTRQSQVQNLKTAKTHFARLLLFFAKGDAKKDLVEYLTH